MLNILDEFGITELSKIHAIPYPIKLFGGDLELESIIDLYKNGKFEQVLERINCDVQNVDFFSLIAGAYFGLKSFEKALFFFQKSTTLANSYHAHFHYFGFNVCNNLAILAKNLNNNTLYAEFVKKAEFLYFHGLKNGLEFKEVRDFENDMLPKFQDLCIFKGNGLMKIIEDGMRFYKMEDYNRSFAFFQNILEENERQHFAYHIFLAHQHFHRGLCFEILGKPEIAIVDYEKALKMDTKNPNNDKIQTALKNLQRIYPK